MLGISRSSVQAALKRGAMGGTTLPAILAYAERTGRSDAAERIRDAIAAVSGKRGRPRLGAAEVTPSARPRGGRKEAADWARMRVREEALRARLVRLELQGLLVRRAAVAERWVSEAAMMRDQLLQIGARLAGRLAAETDAGECRRLVDDEVIVVLRLLSAES
jgi:hypothetical protein